MGSQKGSSECLDMPISVGEAIKNLQLKVERLEKEKRHLRDSIDSRKVFLQQDYGNAPDDEGNLNGNTDGFAERELRDQVRQL